jgi:hypothetical protein
LVPHTQNYIDTDECEDYIHNLTGLVIKISSNNALSDNQPIGETIDSLDDFALFNDIA